MTITPTVVATFPAKIPIPSVPFADAQGLISKAWLYFFIQLWNRTGGGSGVDITTIQMEISALAIEEAMSGGPVPRFLPISVADVMDGPPPQNVAFLALLADVLHAAPRPSLNPFLPALMLG